MKLLYLYIRDYGILQDVGFNLDSEYKFEFDKESYKLKVTQTDDPLSYNFFTINKDQNTVVTKGIRKTYNRD